jgi:hypothetical protein
VELAVAGCQLAFARVQVSVRLPGSDAPPCPPLLTYLAHLLKKIVDLRRSAREIRAVFVVEHAKPACSEDLAS